MEQIIEEIFQKCIQELRIDENLSDININESSVVVRFVYDKLIDRDVIGKDIDDFVASIHVKDLGFLSCWFAIKLAEAMLAASVRLINSGFDPKNDVRLELIDRSFWLMQKLALAAGKYKELTIPVETE
ncbi:hypothetical protein [Brucella inopinata]|uniref:Uncharacterized protein n=1 Tax=Brucella inopinata TaxID=1218315 RepID=A0AAW7BA48_9HYPH|nr:hypothetical protein [Brucella inopinata]KEY04619.1 hypothetical protein IL59_0209495 [Brucella suis bv. 4 str. 40]MDL2334156.1 hypothetical protein [Brucella inopinata]